MCNLYSITTNQAAISALLRVVNGYVGNLAPMPGVLPNGLNGRQVADAARVIDPKLKVLFITGFATTPPSATGISTRACRSLSSRSRMRRS